MILTENDNPLIVEGNPNWLDAVLLLETETLLIGGVESSGDGEVSLNKNNKSQEVVLLGQTSSPTGFLCHYGSLYRRLTMIRLNNAYVAAVTVCNSQLPLQKLNNDPKYNQRNYE